MLKALIFISRLFALATCIALPQDDPGATPGEDIANYIASDDPSLLTGSAPDELITSDAVVIANFFGDLDVIFDELTGPVGNITSNQSDVATADPVATSRRNLERSLLKRGATSFTISTGFTNTTTGAGYNLTLPQGTCIADPIGTFNDPLSGETLGDGTLGAFFYAYNHASKTPAEWRTWTRTNAQNALNNVLQWVDEGPCEGGLKLKATRAPGSLTPSERRDLVLYQRQMPVAQRQRFSLGTGFWTATFLATVPGFGATFGCLTGILLAAEHHSINVPTEAFLITALGFITAVVSNILYRLDIQAAFGRFEIQLLNLFVVLANNIAQRITQCVTGGALQRAIQAYQDRFLNNPQAPQQAAVPGAAENQPVPLAEEC